MKYIIVTTFITTILCSFSCNPYELDDMAEVIHHYYGEKNNKISFTISTNETVDNDGTPNTIWATGSFERKDPPSSSESYSSALKNSVLVGIVDSYFSDLSYNCSPGLSADQPFDKNRKKNFALKITALGNQVSGELAVGAEPVTPVKFYDYSNGLEKGHLLFGKYGPGYTKSIVVSIYSVPNPPR